MSYLTADDITNQATLKFIFGLGKLTVTTNGNNVEVRLASKPGKVGEYAPDEELEQPIVLNLCFPSSAQARKVAEAMCGH